MPSLPTPTSCVNVVTTYTVSADAFFVCEEFSSQIRDIVLSLNVYGILNLIITIGVVLVCVAWVRELLTEEVTIEGTEGVDVEDDSKWVI